MHRYQLVKAKADDHMSDTAQSGLVPLRSWFSLDIAARLDQGEVGDELEADIPSEPQSWAILPARLPRLWSRHRNVDTITNSIDSDVQEQHMASRPPADTDPKQLG